MKKLLVCLTCFLAFNAFSSASAQTTDADGENLKQKKEELINFILAYEEKHFPLNPTASRILSHLIIAKLSNNDNMKTMWAQYGQIFHYMNTMGAQYGQILHYSKDKHNPKKRRALLNSINKLQVKMKVSSTNGTPTSVIVFDSKGNQIKFTPLEVKKHGSEIKALSQQARSQPVGSPHARSQPVGSPQVRSQPVENPEFYVNLRQENQAAGF